MIDLEFLRGLIGAVDESGIDSLEISRGGTRIRISKTPPPAPVHAAAPPEGRPVRPLMSRELGRRALVRPQRRSGQ